LAEENATNSDIKETDINFIMFFIFFPLFKKWEVNKLSDA